MGLPIKGLLKLLGNAFKTAERAEGVAGFGKLYKSVSSVTKEIFPIAEGVNPKAISGGLRGRLVRTLIPKDITKTIVPIPRPLTESEKLAITIRKFQDKYPHGLPIPKQPINKVFVGTAIGSTAVAFGLAKRTK